MSAELAELNKQSAEARNARAALGWLHMNCGTTCHNKNPEALGHGTGLRFRRTDTGREIAARHDAVIDTRLCTVLGDADPGSRIGTVEHLLAAFAAAGVSLSEMVSLNASSRRSSDSSSSAT